MLDDRKHAHVFSAGP